MFYQFKVPPTHDVGSYSGICSSRYGSYRADALQDYNSCRAHDGHEPLTRMPPGTMYTPLVEYVLQGYYWRGWEDLTSEVSYRAAVEQKTCYRDNEGGRYRIVRRAVPADGIQSHLADLAQYKQRNAKTPA